MNNILFILIDYRNTIKDIMWYRIDFILHPTIDDIMLYSTSIIYN